MSADSDLSATALAIAIVALVIAAGQIAQQYASTAEGLRRCRYPVMGSWAEKTESPFLWRELRYQTLFYTPHLSLAHPSSLKNTGKHLIGNHNLPRDSRVEEKSSPGRFSRFMRRRSYEPKSRINDEVSSFRASWLVFLERLQTYQVAAYDALPESIQIQIDEKGKAVDVEAHAAKEPSIEDWDPAQNPQSKSFLSLPAAKIIQYSWDFMPPEIVRPFATITLGDLLVMGYRLGLDWTSVSPLQGSIQGDDDCGNSISSSNIRGFGLMATFTHDDRGSLVTGSHHCLALKPNELFVPTSQADKLAFGIVPGDPELGLDDVVVGTEDDCIKHISTLGSGASDFLRESFRKGNIAKSGFDHLLPIVAPSLAIEGCRTVRLRLPNKWATTGVLNVMEGYLTYKNRLLSLRQSNILSPARRETIEWIVGSEPDTGSQWFKEIAEKIGHWSPANMMNRTEPSKISSTMIAVHDRCTQRLKAWSDALIKGIDEALRAGGGTPGTKDEPHEVFQHDDRRPMTELVRVHMSRAVQLRSKASKHIHDKKDVEVTKRRSCNWVNARKYCQMMHIMLNEIDEVAAEVLDNILGEVDKEYIVCWCPDKIKELQDSIACAWYVMIFRALVFNRSHIFVEPKRTGGKPHALIPAEWYNSQIPVRID